jgi:predicted AlkP superfamily pyrophosphatase or phosphodiesterase
MPGPLILVNAVGLTTRLLPHAPRLQRLAQTRGCQPLAEVLPAVTCTAQASLLTGTPPAGHGIVANGWLYRETMEVRFWQQSNRLLQAEPLYATARRRAAAQGRAFSCAKLFWWFNQGADVDFSVTPKPHYGADGNKAFGITGRPEGLTKELEQRLGPFPFPSFWGPLAGRPATEWIARAAAEVLTQHRPDLTLVYLPHLDYDPQRFGPSRCDLARCVGELDAAFGLIESAAAALGADVWVVSEYGHVDVRRPVYLNRALRAAGLLRVRHGPFGEMLETFESSALAVCDHQMAHVYVNDAKQMPKVRAVLEALPGVAQVRSGAARADWHLDHPRSGDLILQAAPEAWFAYPYWEDDRRAPDFARTVDIHRKPGFDPCELFLDPRLWWPRLRMVRRLVQKKLGFRTLFDVIPLDATLVGGSHGLAAADPLDAPVLLGAGGDPGRRLPMTDVRDRVLQALDLADV